MSSPACRDCRCFQPRPDLGSMLPADLALCPSTPTMYGECRAAPPSIRDRGSYRHTSGHPVTAAWPGVTDACWCDAFKPRDAGQEA